MWWLSRNNEIKFTGQFGDKGVRYQLTVPKGQHTVLSRQVRFPVASNRQKVSDVRFLQVAVSQLMQLCPPYLDVNAHALVLLLKGITGDETLNAAIEQVVKSDSASVSVPELEFEIPTNTQKGTITTVEGLLSEAATGLRTYQAMSLLFPHKLCLVLYQHHLLCAGSHI